MAVEGVVSRSVRDTAVMLDVAAGPCPGDLHTPPLPRRPYRKEVGADPGRLRIGLLTTAPDPSIATHPECVAAAKGVARLLESLGHSVEPQYPPALADPDISQAFLPCYGTWTALHLDWWGQLLGRALTAEDVEPATWAVAELGRTVSGTQFVASLYAMHQYSARVQHWWAEGWDVLVTPTIAEPPPPLGEYAAQPDNPLWPITRAVVEVAYTIPFNMTGQPAISLPLHWTADVLPVGVQLWPPTAARTCWCKWPPSWSRRAPGRTAVPGSTPEPPQRHGQPPPRRPTPQRGEDGHPPEMLLMCWTGSLGAHLGHGPPDNSGHQRTTAGSEIPRSTWPNASDQAC